MYINSQDTNYKNYIRSFRNKNVSHDKCFERRGDVDAFEAINFEIYKSEPNFSIFRKLNFNIKK